MSNTVKSINDDIQRLRGASDESDLDYDRIRLMAKQVPFPSHPLEGLEDKLVARLYIKLLLSVVQLDQEAAIKKMTFIQWIMKSASMDVEIEDLYRECQQLDQKVLIHAVELIPEDDKMYLLIDSLMTAKINGNANKEAMDFIADLCIVLGIGKSMAESCALLSRISLCQGIEGIEVEKVKSLTLYLDKMGHYISEDMVKRILVLRMI